MKNSLPLLIAASVFSFGQNSVPASSKDPMQAHPFEQTGPWFEGWYTRITDKKTGVSIAVITTSALHENQTLGESKRPPGYVAIILKTSDASVTRSFEEFPKTTEIGNRGSDFRWQAEGFGSASKTWTDIEIPGSARVQIKVKSRKAWSETDSDAGPEGLTAKLPFIPLHWFVFNTNGVADYALDYEVDGVTHHVEGTGSVHQEKNWGQVFPSSWMWAQATSDDGTGYLTFAGGDLGIGPVKAHSYMLGYRSKGRSIDFRIGQGFSDSFVDEIDSCARKFSLEANNDSYRLKLVATADPKSFAELSIPTESGYQRGGAVESFSATIEVQLFKKKGGLLMPTFELVERRVFRQAALEFGAGAMKCN